MLWIKTQRPEGWGTGKAIGEEQRRQTSRPHSHSHSNEDGGTGTRTGKLTQGAGESVQKQTLTRRVI